ncbi:hypothetical protein G3A41_20540 [Paraburkholderia aspalathi]|nr:hypothetical protein [Paraburkholderia aspalathi]MBK3832503.1 hypothetical protein [Paraburkholderia aspalathi]MBK3862210.1 hypothetical protein [Paraburkholderia aspalathi]
MSVAARTGQPCEQWWHPVVTKVFRKSSMTRNPQERRTPEQVRAGNRRIGIVMFVIAAAFFASVIIHQKWFT